MLRNLLNIFISYIKYFKCIKGIQVIIRKSKINGKSNFVFSNSSIRNSVLNGNVSISEHTTISNSFLNGFNRIGSHSTIAGSSIGSYTYTGKFNLINNTSIGKFCSIGPHLTAGIGNHPTSFVSTSPIFYAPDNCFKISLSGEQVFEEYQKIVIGNDVWIGANVFIAEGLQIGNGAIIGAGAIVTKNIPDYAIVAGVPARIIRYRFEPEVIGLLNDSKWWDRDFEWLRKNSTLFQTKTFNAEDLKKI